MQKICSNCKVFKDTSNYYKLQAQPDGLDYYCKECRNTNSIESQRNKSKKCSVPGCTKPNYSRKMCRVHYERVRRHGSINRKANISVKRPYRLKEIGFKYNIDIDWYLSKIDGPCDICNEKPYQNALHVEHDHACCGGSGSCGKCVRGLVCASCNTHLRHWDKGTIRKDNFLLPKIEMYIRRYERRNMVE